MEINVSAGKGYDPLKTAKSNLLPSAAGFSNLVSGGSPEVRAAPPAAPAPAPASTDDSQLLLLATTTYQARAKDGSLNLDRPSVGQFMEKTGADFATATRLMYGVIGAAPDLRDWKVIMESSDPISSLKAANGLMLEGDEAGFVNTSLAASGYKAIASDQIAARSKNLAILKGEANGVGYQPLNLHIVDENGRYGKAIAWHRETVEQSLGDYNISMTQLEDLATAADAAGISNRSQYMTGGSVGNFLKQMMA